ncbi:p-nitrophenyl phosphatase [Tritrichomonas musculus]|uniref:p-nitrophenyl phosphatase n=1 Tax=Tritrichomonas musculus TaxID=1915356 RepID=A0ABR2K1I0_9EUKA
MLPKVLLSDGDGVIWIGKQGVKGVGDALSRISKLGIKIILVTNNSSKTRDQYLSFLNGIGVTVIPKDNIFSSSYGLALHCKYCGFKSVYVSGSPALQSEIKNQGIEVHNLYTDTEPVKVDAIAVARSTDFNFANISRIINITRKFDNIPIFGSDPDPNILMKPGIQIPGSGSVAACIECATGKKVEVLGKPTDIMFDIVLKHLNVTSDEVIMVGDRVITDIAFASHHKARSIFVLSGMDKREDADSVEDKDKPTYILPSIVEVADMFEKWSKNEK